MKRSELIMIKKLPDAEFEIMKVIWANEPPIFTNTVMEQLGNEKKWKAPTAISLLLRLVERGFLRTEKNGKERVYYPVVTKDDYLKFETQNFMKMYHDNSFVSFIHTLYEKQDISGKDMEEIIKAAKVKDKEKEQ